MHELGLAADLVEIALEHLPPGPGRVGAVTLRLGNREVPARLVDISPSGAALACEARPPLDTLVTVGSTPARLVRYFDDGFGVQFLLPLSPDRFHAGMVL